MTFTIAEKTRILKLKTNLSIAFNAKLNLVNDQAFTNSIRDNCIITGGCISSLFHNEKINDIDLYAKTDPPMNSIKQYILDHLSDHIKQHSNYDLISHTTIPAISENAVTLHSDLQFIYLGIAEKCRSKFDFIHCQPWYDIKTQKLYISHAQYKSIEEKRLLINPNAEPVKFRRIDKYTKRGWTIERTLYDKAKNEIS